MKREYPESPFVGVGVVIWRQEEVLLIRRGKPPREGEWSLPGGAQNVGETVRDTALREVREETGLTIHLGDLIEVVDAIFPDENGKILHHYTLIDFVGEWAAGTAIASDDAAEVRWVLPQDMKKYQLWTETERIILKSAGMRYR